LHLNDYGAVLAIAVGDRGFDVEVGIFETSDTGVRWQGCLKNSIIEDNESK
jgi:hypothetical protein